MWKAPEMAVIIVRGADPISPVTGSTHSLLPCTCSCRVSPILWTHVGDLLGVNPMADGDLLVADGDARQYAPTSRTVFIAMHRVRSRHGLVPFV